MSLTVVKCGGAALARGTFQLGDYVSDGDACVVHGAGGKITAALFEAGIESRFSLAAQALYDSIPEVRS